MLLTVDLGTSATKAVFWRLTGEVATDATFAGRSGFYDLHGALAAETAAGVEELLPPVRASTSSGPLADTQAGLPAGTTVVLGAGDRPCEVLGAGASADTPMVSWGTTANVSLPATTRPDASLAKRYRDLRPLVDRVADGVLGLDLSEWSTGWT